VQTYSVRSGDTLSALAKRFGTSVSEIAKANNISNPNRINVGQKLVIPDGFEGPKGPRTPSKPADSFGSGAPAAANNGGPVRDSNGRQYPTSADGTPMYRQGDPEWGSRTLGTSSSLSAAGCAMTATAMAVSKITGKAINPGQMDAWLDKNGGYSGNGLIWGKAAQMGGLGAAKQAWNLDTINKQIDAGRPVVVGVDYKAGSNGGANGTDHWITITGRGKEGGKDVYYANDPATGKQITLTNQGGQLVGGPKGYKTTGQLVTFSGGNPRPGTAPANGNGGSAPANGTGDKPAPARGTMSGLTLPSGDLERGARGPEVEQLQRALVKGGFMTQAEMNTGPGIFGPKTEAALKEFQAANGVDAIGRYGPKTRAAFEKLGAKVGGAGPSAPTGPVTGPSGPSNGSGVTLEQLRRVMPNLSQAKAEQYLPHLNRAMAEAGITTRNQKAAFLAQLAHESGEFRYMEEIASGAAYEGRRDLGNTQPGDGVRFKGRGPIQLTGRANYTAASKALGIDLVNNPKRAADPDVGFRTAAWFWNTRGLNALAEAGNFREVTRRINGGFNGLASREMYYKRALTVLG
jgi:predicted chitinase/murein DD-endopeptidase MepM/ murein hydrolase activator NlpD